MKELKNLGVDFTKEQKLQIADSVRKDGYYWVKRDGEWSICSYTNFDEGYDDLPWEAGNGFLLESHELEEIDETPVTRESHKIASRAVVVNEWANSGDVRCYEWSHPMRIIFGTDEFYGSEVTHLESGSMF
ncbi:hypothetical protein N9878_01140 [bacterium]|nr:hypothetical protein [bacterium]